MSIVTFFRMKKLPVSDIMATWEHEKCRMLFFFHDDRFIGFSSVCKEDKMLRHIMVAVTIFAALSSANSIAANKIEKEAAITAADSWLEMVDKGSYSQSWEEAARYFKSAVTVEQWFQSLRAVRKPLGKVLSRTVSSTSYMTSLPGAPDGEYFVIQFTTSFEKKKSAVETVTPMKDKDGKWRVSGYYIK